MGLETGTWIDDLISTNPVGGTDPFSEGDDHLRLIKSVLKSTFPNATKAFYFETVDAAKTGAYTVVAADARKLIPANATTAPFTLTLTAAATLGAGWSCYIIKSDSSANAVTIDGNGTETINGAITLALSGQYHGVRLQCDGSNFYAFEFNFLKGVTATVAEINKLAGTPAGLTATELGYLDGATSGIQGQLDLKAPLASPALTGSPTAPTQTAGNSSTLLATTAFVTTADNLKANLASPALTGTPTAPTATAGTNTTQVATTAFVQGEISTLTLGTALDTSTGTAFDFTSIPSGVNEIFVYFQVVSLASGGQDILIQLGDAGGPENTGYLSESLRAVPAGNTASTSTAGFAIKYSAIAENLSGLYTLKRISGTTWVGCGTFNINNGSENGAVVSGGRKALSAELTQLRITRSITGNFDSGVVNISYR